MKKTVFVDTNIFLRLITKDNKEKAKKSLELFQRAANGELILITAAWNIAEIVYVLSSKKTYAMARQEISRILLSLLNIKNILVDNKTLHIQALGLYSDNKLDYEDCLNIVYMRQNGIGTLYSYDREFDGEDSIIREEP